MPAEPVPHPARDTALRLPASLDLGAAPALLEQVRAGLAEGGLVLDGSAVERVSVPCLQILAAARREGGGQPGLRIVGASAALAAAVSDLGLATAIPLEG